MLGATATAAAAVTGCSRVAAQASDIQLTAKAGRARLLSDSTVSTAVFGYGGQVPGRELRLRQGDRLRVSVKNELQEETTVHWHGIRLPNAMDGVPHLTQKPIKPGETFLYDFVAPDAGTYWYHPHHNSSQQVGRGLYGPLIVEEAEPIKVDRDITWLLGDWRLHEDGQISDDFGNMHDSMHAGRVGNTITINGLAPQPLAVRTGERVRLRLINVANARIFGLKFAGHSPKIIALDGQPVTPHEPSGAVLVGPAMRVDLIIDMVGDPSSNFTVEDTFYKGLEYALTTLEYGGTPLRQALLPTPVALPPNRIADATQHFGRDRRCIGQFVELAAHVRPAESEADLVTPPGERGIAAIAIDLQDAGKIAEMRFGSLAPAVGGVDIGDHRRITAAPRAIVAGIDP